MTLFCNHNWQQTVIYHQILGAYIPTGYECTKCRKRKVLSPHEQQQVERAKAQLERKR